MNTPFKLFYSIVGGLCGTIIITLIMWWLQSQQIVVTFDDNPGYRIIEVTKDHIEVKWINAKLQVSCPGRVEPILWGESASYAIASYPFVVQPYTTTFTRRYPIPEYFPDGDYELRINMVAQCNPLFETRQILRVPFRYVFSELDWG